LGVVRADRGATGCEGEAVPADQASCSFPLVPPRHRTLALYPNLPSLGLPITNQALYIVNIL
jgi:hypothetical protein